MDSHDQFKEQNLIQSLIDGLQSDQQIGSQQDSFVLDGDFMDQCQTQLEIESKRKPQNDINDLIKETQLEFPQLNQDDVNKKLKTSSPQIQQFKMQIHRKISDDLIKLFEQMPKEDIGGLLDRINTINQKTPDMRIRLEIGRLLPNELGGFNLNDDKESSADAGKKGSGSKKRQEKQCKCCGQLVKRHLCKHSHCVKPCNALERMQKLKQKNHIE